MAAGAPSLTPGSGSRWPQNGKVGSLVQELLRGEGTPTPLSAAGSLPQGEAVAVVRETEQAASSSLHPAWIGYSKPGPAERPGACTHARTRGDTEHSKRPLSSLRWPHNHARKFKLSTAGREPETPHCSPKPPQDRDVPPHSPSAPGTLRWRGRHLWARPLPAGETQATQT